MKLSANMNRKLHSTYYMFDSLQARTVNQRPKQQFLLTDDIKKYIKAQLESEGYEMKRLQCCLYLIFPTCMSISLF